MDTKLTLSLDKDVIEKAKTFAKSKNTSLSNLIENYLLHLTKESEVQQVITPWVKGMSGIIDLPADFDHKEDYADRLTRKHKL